MNVMFEGNEFIMDNRLGWRKLFICFLLIPFILGGCQTVDSNKTNHSGITDDMATNDEATNNDDQLMSQARETAIQFFKEKYDLEVEVTNQKKLPAYVADEIDVEGYVVGHKDQTFNISVNYKTLQTKNFVMSPELEKVIQAKKQN